MPARSHPLRSAAEWDESFDLFHASGLTQRGFCEQHRLSHDAFRNRYRASAKFAGKRRRSPGAAGSPDRSSPAFRPVTTARAAAATPLPPAAGAATVIVRLHQDIRVECLPGSDPCAVAALVRELLR